MGNVVRRVRSLGLYVRLLIPVALSAVVCCSALAVSPEAIIQGKLLFEKDWSPRNPQLGADGLGPLFNGRSCATCHNQGGVGGGGDATFNAKTLGIQRMKISGRDVTEDIVRQALRKFHPGFIGPSGDVLNIAPIPHHGGSPQYKAARQAVMKHIPAVFSEHGGAVNATEVRQANATPILYTANEGGRIVAIRARLYQRNTPAIFGAGLIDRVTDKMLAAIEREQKKHPEISGRPATLSSGLTGRFGWRGNVPSLLDFCDQACANELGLETKRMPQPTDPTLRSYRNPSHDISDSMIKSMAAFMSALPAPTRMIPDDSQLREQVVRGEQVFASVGCAVCHVPDMGPAKGVYSDLLLHDMAQESHDLNRAQPYITKVTPVTKLVAGSGSTVTTRAMVGGYYGAGARMVARTQTLGANNSGSQSFSTGSGNRTRTRDGGYDFVAPTRPVRMMVIPDSERSVEGTWEVTKTLRLSSGSRTFTDTIKNASLKTHLRIHHEVTNFNQEWRTPPLWGVRDSAPYMHDGRAETLLEAITMHEGEAAKTRDRFLMLSVADRRAVIEFLNTMVAPQIGSAPALAVAK